MRAVEARRGCRSRRGARLQRRKQSGETSSVHRGRRVGDGHAGADRTTRDESNHACRPKDDSLSESVAKEAHCVFLRLRRARVSKGERYAFIDYKGVANGNTTPILPGTPFVIF